MQVSGWENPPNGVWGGEARRASDRGRQQRWRQGPQKPLWDLPLHPAARQTKSPASACSCTLDAIFLAALAEAAPRVVWLLFGGGGEGVSFWIPTPLLLCCSLLFPHHPFFLCFCFFFLFPRGAVVSVTITSYDWMNPDDLGKMAGFLFWGGVLSGRGEKKSRDMYRYKSCPFPSAAGGGGMTPLGCACCAGRQTLQGLEGHAGRVYVRVDQGPATGVPLDPVGEGRQGWLGMAGRRRRNPRRDVDAREIGKRRARTLVCFWEIGRAHV